jgi:hypothetical protein
MECGSIFMSNTNCQIIKLYVERGRVVTTLNMMKHWISYIVHLCYLGGQKGYRNTQLQMITHTNQGY